MVIKRYRANHLNDSSIYSFEQTGSSGGHDRRFSRDSLPVFFFFFSAGCLCEQFWHGHRYPFFDADHPAFPLQTTASPTFQNALNDSFHQAVVACDVPEPCKFLSLNNFQKRFLWTYKEVDLAPHAVIGLVLQVGDMEKFPSCICAYPALDLNFVLYGI